MKKINLNWITIIFVTVGMIIGYLYYYFVGCLTGTCPLKSNPYIMTIYGGVIGYLLKTIFISKDKEA